jgi:LysM repeat protein
VSRKRRKPRPGVAHYAAPVAFLAGVTIAALLVHSALNGSSATTTTPSIVVTVDTTPVTTKRPGTAKQRFYVVQTGDSFGTIASKQGITIGQLQSLNPNVSSNSLQVGQKLRVK